MGHHSWLLEYIYNEAIEGPVMKGTKIVINTAGIEGGKRKDGVTYFGQALSDVDI
jgi:hypothetical protein